MTALDIVAMTGAAAVFMSFLGLVIIYNGLVNLKNDCDRAWSNIDVLLKQRYNEIPNLVEVCRGYMKHEQETLTRVIEARSAGMAVTGPIETGPVEGRTVRAMNQLFATAEGYPDLKASHEFLNLSRRITGLENEISDRREYFNNCVNNYNTRIEQLPDAVVAGWLHYNRKPLLTIPAAERRVPSTRAA